MKLSKALKVKNSLVKEINDLKAKIQKHNVVIDDNDFQFDTKDLYKQLLDKSAKLALLKKEISVANGSIIQNIFNLAEFKGIIAMLSELNTQKGTVSSENFRGGEVKHTYKPQIDDQFVSDAIKGLEKSMETLQDEIDEYNATHEIPNI